MGDGEMSETEQTARFVRHRTRIIFDRREMHRTQLKADSQAEADELIEILNALEARAARAEAKAALADEQAEWVREMQEIPWATSPQQRDWLARYDALTQGAGE